MAWTHYVKARTDTLSFIDDRECVVIVAIERFIYVIGYDLIQGELQVHIFHPETSTWDIVRFTDDNSDPFPREMAKYFAVAHDDSILLYAQDYFMEISIFVFNTKTLQWKRLSPSAEISRNDHWWGGCLLHGELYILKLGDIHFELWALDLSSMRWRFVSEAEWKNPYYPLRFLAYETRIYVHMEDMRDESKIINIVYFDTVNKKWEWLDAPGGMLFSQPAWTSFFYSKYFYYVSGIPDQRELIFRYSLERNEWEGIKFEGVSPLQSNSIGNVTVLDNKAFFLEFRPAGIHVLDLQPSLKTRCLAAVSKYELDTSGLPVSLQTELSKYWRST